MYYCMGPRETCSEFCFPENRGEVEGNIEAKGKQNSLFPAGQSLSVLLYTSLRFKSRKKLRRNCLLYVGWLTNLSCFQGARLNHIQCVWVESSYSFPTCLELLKFVRMRYKFSFNPRTYLSGELWQIYLFKHVRKSRDTCMETYQLQ